MLKLFNTLLALVCVVCFTACKDREKQYTYYDEGKTKPKEIYEIDKETGLRDGPYKAYLESGALACTLTFVEGEVKERFCEENVMVNLRDYQVACFTACRDREKQYTYYDEGKTKPKEIYEIDKETGLRDGLYKVYLESGALACALVFVEGKVKEHSCEENVMVDLRDYQIYRTVKIAKQIWMAENLKYKAKSSVCSEDKESNCAKYGRLYSWRTARTVCPPGWHLPSRRGFEILLNAVGGTQDEEADWYWHDAGKRLKSASGWDYNRNGDDSFGFSALPVGFRSSGYGEVTAFWSSTESEYDSREAFRLYLKGLGGEAASLDLYDKSRGYSVRCLRD